MLVRVRALIFFLLLGLGSQGFSVPFAFTYAGKLLDNSGTALSGTQSVKITFWDAQTGGSQLAANEQTGATNDTYSVNLVNGVFSQVINLSAANFHLVFPDDTTGTWVEVEAAGITYPRQQFTAVPYALKVPVDNSTITYNSSGELQVSSIGSVANLNAATTLSTTSAGSAAAPALFFAGDTNTGIYSSGADSLSMSTNGQSRLTIDSSGNVGIGTPSPEAALNIGLDKLRVGSELNPFWVDYGTNRVEFNRAGGASYIDQSGIGGSLSFRVSKSTPVDTAAMTINSSGNVGVGASPLSNAGFHVKRTSSDPGAASEWTNYNVTNSTSATSGTHYTIGQGNWGLKTVNQGVTDTGYITGAWVSATANGGGTLSNATGVYSVAGLYHTDATGTIVNTHGYLSKVYNQGAGSMTNAYGLRSTVQNVSSGTITNGYGVYIDSLAGVANRYGIYQDGTSDKNYFAGNVGIGTATPLAGLHNNKDSFKSTSLDYEKDIQLTFPHGVANQKASLEWNTESPSLWGWIEVEATSYYWHQNAAGKIKKLYSIGANGGTTFVNSSHYTEVSGKTADNWALGDLTWDSSRSKWYIPIVHRTSTGNVISLRVRVHASSPSYIASLQDFSLGSIYTTDTTVYPVPVVSVPSQLEVGGPIKLGSTTSSCDSTTEGQQRYNSTSKSMEFCNGTAWTAYGRRPAIAYGKSSTTTTTTQLNTAPFSSRWNDDIQLSLAVNAGDKIKVDLACNLANTVSNAYTYMAIGPDSSPGGSWLSPPNWIKSYGIGYKGGFSTGIYEATHSGTIIFKAVWHVDGGTGQANNCNINAFTL